MPLPTWEHLRWLTQIVQKIGLKAAGQALISQTCMDWGLRAGDAKRIVLLYQARCMDHIAPQPVCPCGPTPAREILPSPTLVSSALPLQHDTGAVSLPEQCLPLTLTSAPAVHAMPAQGAAPGLSGAARLGVPARERQVQPPPGEPPRPPGRR